jgi:hypothetical protein
MTIQEFKTYFKDLSISHVDIDAFVWGDAFEQIQDLLLNTNGIVMMVDSPDFALENHDLSGRSISYESELVILKLTQRDDVSRKSNDLVETMDIIIEVIRKIEEDFTDNLNYEFEIKSKLTQVFMDNRIGWRFKFNLDFDINVYKNDSKWQ